MITQCQPVSLAPSMTVVWVNARENFTLWNYDPTTNVYTAPNPGLLAGRASVVAGPTTVFSICPNSSTPPEPVLQGGNDGSVQALSLSEYGGPAGGFQPQLQFWIGPRRVASVSLNALKVNAISESGPAGGNVFKILANGSLAGTLSAAGLVANAVEEL